MKRVYFDNAASTPLLPEVIEKMTTVLTECYGNPSSIHFFGRKSRTIIEESRKTIANYLNASLGEVFFTSCATESNNLCLKMAVEHLGIERIISSPTEHHCVLHTIEALDAKIESVQLSVNEFGSIDLNELQSILEADSKKTLVSLMYVNNEIGTKHPVDLIAEICEKNNAFLHCDAVQAIGKFDVDTSKNKISFLSGSAHKFHGPKGIGFVYINQDNIIPPLIHGGAQERNMRSGTENVAGIAGMALALEMAIEEKEERKAKILSLRNQLKLGLKELIPEIKFNGLQGEDEFLYTVLSASFPAGAKTELLNFNMDIAGIAVSGGSACSSGVENTSHVLEAIGHDPKRKTIRFSFSHLNTMEEVEYVLQKISEFYPKNLGVE